MHIAPTPFFADRGGHLRIKGIIEGLEKRGVSNVLCTYHLGRNVKGIVTVRSARIPGYTKQEAGPSPFKYFADILLLWTALRTVARAKPDLIYAHLHEGALIGWIVKLALFWRRTPLVFDVQGSLVGELQEHGYFGRIPLLRRIFWFVEYLIARMPDRFICSSGRSREILVRDFRVAPETVHVVHDGSDLEPVSPAEIPGLRERLGLNGAAPIVVYAGGLLPGKGLETLCGVLATAHRSGPDCHFLIIGYPDAAMRQFVSEQGIESTCTVTGRVPYEQLAPYLAAADVGLEPKLAGSGEASGKVLNYMAVGLPVVCFDTPNNRSLLGDSGFYSEEPSVDGLLGQINRVVSDRTEAERRGSAGRERMLANFSWAAGAARILAICEGVTGRA